MKVKKRNEVGADRVVNALAAYKLYGAPAIVIDFGTATTFDVISAKGEYWGGAIAPGINLARDALYHQTAKLPKVEIKAPRKVIGTDTVSAMQSGLVYGYVAMVEGMLQRIKCQMSNDKCQMKVIATGGYAPLICKYTNMVDCVDQDLTLKGLRLAGQNLPR
jgi:type III pantothenate kinase